MNDDELLDALGDALHPPARPVPPAGLDAVRAQAAAAGASPPADAAPGAGGGPSRRTLLVGSIAAAVGAAAGVAGTVMATSGSGSSDEAAEPPTRPVEFSAVPAGTTVSGRTIDHTWGMELLLDVSGLPVDRDYEVTYATASGPVAAGGFRSVAVPMVCRFNGTALRSAVTEVSIADGETGDVVLRGRPV